MTKFNLISLIVLFFLPLSQSAYASIESTVQDSIFEGRRLEMLGEREKSQVSFKEAFNFCQQNPQNCSEEELDFIQQKLISPEELKKISEEKSNNPQNLKANMNSQNIQLETPQDRRKKYIITAVIVGLGLLALNPYNLVISIL